MKLAVRIFAFCLVLAGAAAASFSSSANTRVMAASHMSATAGLPIPYCGPGVSCGGGHGR